MVEYPAILSAFDRLDEALVKLKLKSAATWSDALRYKKLYAGKLRRGLPQYNTHIGLTPFRPSTRNISHDVLDPMPLLGSIDIYQSEDVFEHIPYNNLVNVINNVYDVLRPGGLFRLSLPDYRCDIYNNRCVLDGDKILFDPGGGGKYLDGKVIEGGHLWFPIMESVTTIIESSKFNRYDIFEGYMPDQSRIMKVIDYSKGYVQRSSANDPRVKDDPRPLSIIIDLTK